MQNNGLSNLKTTRQNRVEARHRFLKNHGDLISTHPTHLIFAQAQQVSTAKENFSRLDLPGRLRYKAHDRKRTNALTAPALTDQSERLSSTQFKRYAIYSLTQAFFRMEVGAEIAHF